MAVLVKRSSVASKVPLTTDLNYGELAVNSYDGRLFMKANNGGGDKIIEITSVTSLLNKSITTNVTLSATEYANAMLVFSGALTGNTVVTVPNTAHSFIVVNKTTGNYSLTIASTGMTPSVSVVQGAAESLLCDTTGVYATASTTGVEFSKLIPCAASFTADITYAGAVVLVTTPGITITMPLASSYPGGAGFGILNVSGGSILVTLSGSDTSELGIPVTVRNNDSYYLAADNVSKWHCVWYSNPSSPTFTSANILNTLSVGSTLTVTGASNLNGGATITGTSTLNGPVILTNAGPSVTFNASGPAISSPASNTLATSNGTAEVFRINSSGHFLVGTTTDDGSNLAVSGDIGSQQGKFTSTRFGNGGSLVLRSAAGTFASSTALTSGSQSGTITFRSFDGANYQDNASIDSWVEATTTNTSSPGNLRFYTTPTGAITKSERMRISARGGVLIGTSTDDGSSAILVTGTATFNNTVVAGSDITSNGGKVTGSNSAGALTASNGGGAGQTSIILKRTAAATDQKTWELIQGADGSFGLRTVNDAYSASQYAIQVARSTTYTLGAMSLMGTGGHVLIGGTTDDGVNELQVTGTVKSTGGFVFPDGTTQTTANGVTAPTSTVYTPANGVSTWAIGAYNIGFVQVFKNNLKLIPTVDFTATDGVNLSVTTAATGRDRYEVLTSVVYSPSAVFAPTSYTTSVTSGLSLITTNYTVGCLWVFKNNLKLIPTVDFTATNGSTITLTNASDSSTDVYEVVTFQPFASNAMLPLIGGTLTGALTVNALITSTTGGFKFPDGTTQTTASSGSSGGVVPNIPAIKAVSTYTLVLTDAPLANNYQGIIQFSVASTVTVPLNSSVAFPVGTSITFIQNSSGQITLAATSGVTINTPSTLVSRTQYSAIQITKLATDTWILTGDMS